MPEVVIDLVAVFHGAEHLLHFLPLPRLRHDHQKIHDAEHQQERQEETAKPTPEAASLHNKNAAKFIAVISYRTLSESASS